MLALLLLVVAATAADVDNGQKIYVANCQACHGARADGKGPAAAALRPPPTDFTDPAYWSGRTDAQVKASIKSGKPGTSMMPFANLNPAELDDLVAFLRSRSK